MKEMRILIADDHPIFRHGLVRVVEGTPGFAVVGEAGNGKEALALLTTLQPDIAVLDISMPEMDGLEVMRAARRGSYEGAFVVLTMYREEEYFNEALDLGALGYLLKESATSDLLHCLRTVTEGKHYVSPEMSHHLVVRTAKRDRLNQSIPSIASLWRWSAGYCGLLRPTEPAERSPEKSVSATAPFRTTGPTFVKS